MHQPSPFITNPNPNPDPNLSLSQADLDNSGTIDAEEMYALVQILFRRLGVPLRDEMLPLLKEEVTTALDLYDDDGSGELDFDEFCSVLCKDPWRELLPSDSRKKEDSNRTMKNFCMCDLIFVDGDPHLLPWDRRVTDLLGLVRQVMYSQTWPRPQCVTMLGSAIVTQMMQYLQLVGAKILPIFNGTPPGAGTKLKAIERIDVSQEAIKVGAYFLDHSTGDCYKWNKKLYDEKFPKKAWEFVVNIGMIMHAGRNEPPRKYDASGDLVDSTKTIVKRETKAYQHFLFQGMTSMNFIAPVQRNWDVIPRIEGKVLTTLANSMRGTEIVTDPNGACIGTMFSFTSAFRDTEKLVFNFVKQKFHFLRVNEDSKAAWFDWMLGSANNGKLKFWFPPPYRNYDQPQGIKYKERPQSPEALERKRKKKKEEEIQLDLEKKEAEAKDAKKMTTVMDENGNRIEIEADTDPNAVKNAALKDKRDAEADAAVEAHEKANAWDAGRDAPTMAKLMKFNMARCQDTIGADGVNQTTAGAIPQEGESLADKMKRKGDDEYSQDTPPMSTRSMAIGELDNRPGTASSMWTPDPKTGRKVKLLYRIPASRAQTQTMPKRRPGTAMSGHSGSSAGSMASSIGHPTTKYEREAWAREERRRGARSQTPEGYQSPWYFDVIQQRKEGHAKTMADTFVPNPYTSDAERIKRELKMQTGRNVGGVFYTASGTRKIRGITYASDPYSTFSFDRPIHRDKWMRDRDFIKMGRTLQPFDGPLPPYKAPPKTIHRVSCAEHTH